MKEIERYIFDEDGYFQLFQNNSGFCVRIWSDDEGCQSVLADMPVRIFKTLDKAEEYFKTIRK